LNPQRCLNVEITTSVQLSNTTIFQRWCVTVVSKLLQRCCACWVLYQLYTI